MLLGEKWFNSEEVIRIMTDLNNAVYKKKVKVYSETFNKYRWMEKIDIESNYTLLIPVAYMRITVVKATTVTYNLDDILIDLRLNKKSMFTDEAQIEEEEEYDYTTYSTIFARLDSLIDCTDSLMKENPAILMDNKPTKDKLAEIIDRFADEDETFFEFSKILQNENQALKYKDSAKLALYVNDYYDSILQVLKPKIKLYDSLVAKAFNKIKEMTKTDFKINTFKQLLDDVLGVVGLMDVRLNIDDFPMKEVKRITKENDLNTLYMFDNETMMNIVKYSFIRTIHDFMILKYWYDIDITSFTYKYHLIRNSIDGELFIILCKTGNVVYNYIKEGKL